MRRMTPYEWQVYYWFTETVRTLKELEKLCEKYYGTKDVDVLDVDKVIEMYEKENPQPRKVK